MSLMPTAALVWGAQPLSVQSTYYSLLLLLLLLSSLSSCAVRLFRRAHLMSDRIPADLYANLSITIFHKP